MRLMPIVAAVLVAACTTPSLPAQVTAPVWTRQSVPTLPYERLQEIHGVAGWNGGFVVAGVYYLPAGPDVVEMHREVPVLHRSVDGETWRELPVPSIQSFVLGESAAGYGDRGYVLGNNDEGPVVLTSEGDAWTQLPLPGANAEDEAMSIVAGPRGVVVVALVGLKGIEAEAVKTWYSADGRTFSGPVAVWDRPISMSDATGLAATERGFLLPVSDATLWGEFRQIRLYESVDGRVWTAPDAEFPEPSPDHYLFELRAVQHNNGVTVAFGTTQDRAGTDDDPGPVAWYRRDGETTWNRIDLDPGRLPDAGVVPANLRDVWRVYRWRTGFLALGLTGYASAVWTSQDGVKWSKMPVRDNGFESTHQLRFGTNGRTSLMLRQSPDTKLTGPTQIWRA